ncbi:hypothetical protein D1006_38040 [Burkholderia stabilis]|uniref:Uncharacterized protein n=1 Tax=Burkholderia stabilis TaxID=95485 RepID=A0A4Q2AAC4_9BURK|nr:hypothetical protein D1006_38040 [Burkholderia stabilis]
MKGAGRPSRAVRIVESDRKLASTGWRIQIISSDFLTSIRVKGRRDRCGLTPAVLLNLYRLFLLAIDLISFRNATEVS